MEPPAYLNIAQKLESQILSGALGLGVRIPSVRVLSAQQDVSVATILRAYEWLEARGCIEAHQRSGYYVRAPFQTLIPEPEFRPVTPYPLNVGDIPSMDEILSAARTPDLISLGASAPHVDVFPAAKLNKILRRVICESPNHSASYDFPPGRIELRREIARRSLAFGGEFNPNDIVVTSGGIEAIVLCLRAVARPGQVVAIEIPTYYGVLAAIQSLGLKVLEIPTHHNEGIDLGELERSLRKHKVAALLTMPNCNSPLGHVMNESNKQRLVDLCERHHVPVIENDVFRELAFGETFPRPAKSYDNTGNVLLCSSFSKTLGPGFRVGWVHAGKYRDAVTKLKFTSSLATASLPQLVVAEFLASGGYERHVRRIRYTFSDHVQAFTHAITKCFPSGTKMTRPRGGYILWVQLPKRASSEVLFRRALKRGVFVTPGSIFSVKQQFRNCLRVNAGMLWSSKTAGALRVIGELASERVSSAKRG